MENKCLDCGERITRQAKRCHSCAAQKIFDSGRMTGLINKSFPGKKNGRWKGGRVIISNGNYIGILTPNHPTANPQGYVGEHRLMAEKAISRYLKSDEIVHHLNGNPQDNRNDNLLICDSSFHKWLHCHDRILKRDFGEEGR